MKQFVFTGLVLISFISAQGEALDSMQTAKSQPVSSVRLATRIHSLGQFAYGGRIVSDNPVIDFNINYDRKNWGIQVFKAMDLRDSGTPINFTLAVLNRNFHITNRLTVTPSAGFILEQSKTIADPGSDVTIIVTTAYKISKEWTIDHSALFGNLALEPKERDWVNRFRLTYSRRHMDFFATFWHNNKVFDAAEYMTYGLSAFYSRVRLSDRITVHAGVSGLFMPCSNDPAAYPKKNGVIFTLALAWH